jgi:hypothetical protein
MKNKTLNYKKNLNDEFIPAHAFLVSPENPPQGEPWWMMATGGKEILKGEIVV